MAKATNPRGRRAPPPPAEAAPRPSLLRRLRRLVLWGIFAVLAAVVSFVALLGAVAPPATPYMIAESRRLGGIDQEWVPLEDIAPAMARAAVAAEDAGFCQHWGFDLAAIRAALASGADRGGSTIDQQVVKNVFLWQGRSWLRKSLEATLTPLAELLWSKRRILELYLNLAEFGEGTFGVEAAAQRYFGVPASDLSDEQAALLAAVLPAPKSRDPSDPTPELAARASSIMDGAATIARDGRAACFQP